MLLTLMKNDEMNTTVLPERVSGKYSVSHSGASGIEEVLLVVEADGEAWKIKCGSGSEILTADGTAKECAVEAERLYTILIARTNEKAYLFAQTPDITNMQYRKVIPNDSCSFSIGTMLDCDIYVGGCPDSQSFVRIDYVKGAGFSVNGYAEGSRMYKNRKKLADGRINSGEVLSLYNIYFVFGRDFIAYNFTDNVHVKNQSLFYPFIPMEKTDDIQYYFDDEYNHGLFFCSPRFKKEISEEEISIEYPPQSSLANQMPIALTIGPSVTMGLSSAATASFTVINQLSRGGEITAVIPSVIMASSMLLSSLMWPIITKTYDKNRKKKQERKRKVKYAAYLRKQYEVVDALMERQKNILCENNPSLECLSARIETRDRALWERRAGQSDFLSLSLGTGDVPLKLSIKCSEEGFTLDEDPLREEAVKFLSRSRILNDVPVEISLMTSPITGIIGERSRVLDYTKGWILQLAALYSYEALGMIILYDESEREYWEPLRWLPHIWNENADVRMIASDVNELKVISAETERIRLDENSTKRYVIISASRRLALKADFLGRIIRSFGADKFSVVALYDAMNYLPKECTEVVELESGSSTAKLYRMDSNDGTAKEFNAVDSSVIELGKLSVALSNIKLAQNSEGFTLPPSYTFLEMFGVSKVEHLNCLRRWAESNPVESLAAPIGIDSHGDLCMLDLHQKYHGPHGLIAGMTGSGKSEFIMTVILSLAVNYHPNEVAFILIDYKGGGMAHAFEHLPHVAGIITNLDGAAITRSLVSIQSELKRRQRVFSEAEQQLGISNLDIYKYQKLYRDGKVSEPLPHLMIISDEFAELKTQQPDFMNQLISAARIGRSLGVHLILATQKPSGVVSDQIWSNSKFKICLKVQDNADSMEMIKRPDAAALVDVGRFYLQVGYNEYFELGQSAWCGANYEPEGTVKREAASITVIDKIGRTIIQTDDNVKSQRKKSALDKKHLDAVTDYISALAEEEKISVRALWLEPIPDVIIIDELIEKYGYIQPKDRLCVVIGEYDIPANQEQKLLYFDLEQAGNILTYGASGAGKTTMLTAMTYNLCKCYSPSDVWIYILDFNAQTLKTMKKLKHVGDVFLPDDKEKLNRFFSWLARELNTRRKTLSESDGGYYSYTHSGGFMPWITVMIHNYGAFAESYPEYEDLIGMLTREGIKYGISFVVTGSTTNAVKFRIAQNFKTQLSLQLNDDSYSIIFGSTHGMKPSPIKGRGLVAMEDINEFQTAYITQPDEVAAEIQSLAEKLDLQYPDTKAYSVPVLPELYKPSISHTFTEKAGKVPLGLFTSNVEPYMYSVERPVIFVISKSERKPVFIQGFAEMLAEKADVIVYDHADKFLPVTEERYKRFTEKASFMTAVSDSSTTSERLFVIISGMGDLLGSMRMPEREEFSLLIEKAKTEKKITLIMADKTSSTSTYSSEKWYKEILADSSYIWLGNGLFDQYQFPCSNRGRNVEIPEDCGYIVENGRADCVKLISSEVFENEK